MHTVTTAHARLQTVCMARAHALYGENLPEAILCRLQKELDEIEKNDSARHCLAALHIADHGKSQGSPVGCCGTVGASFLLYLLGVTEINPLPPHYVCPQCHYIEFPMDSAARNGLDLPVKSCPHCGAPMRADGQNMPSEMFFGLDNGLLPKILLTVAPEAEEEIQKMLTEAYPEDEKKIDVRPYGVLGLLRQLEALTGVKPADILLRDPAVLALFRSGETEGIPEFDVPIVQEVLTRTKPETYADLLRIAALMHGTNTWSENAEVLLRRGVCTLSDVIASREDLLLFLIGKGMDKKTAFWIMEGVRKGKGLRAEHEERMRALDVPDWYIDSCKKIHYLFPMAHAAAYTMTAIRFMWYKMHYPEMFEKAMRKERIG